MTEYETSVGYTLQLNIQSSSREGGNPERRDKNRSPTKHFGDDGIQKNLSASSHQRILTLRRISTRHSREGGNPERIYKNRSPTKHFGDDGIQKNLSASSHQLILTLRRLTTRHSRVGGNPENYSQTK